MGKTLKVSLAMGGGVSLGSFSGSALTEALKLLLIFGKDAKGKPYDNVIVDGMSGASAGAIALTIMLRCLIDYKSMLLKWKTREKSEKVKEDLLLINRENQLILDLAESYFGGDISKLESLGALKKEALIALQLAQNIQRLIWVDSVDAIQLYGDKINKNPDYALDDSFGLLERKHMEGLISEYLLGDTPDLNNIRVLAKDRVLFACSLTNILPMPINTKKEGITQLQENVLKSTGVFNHAEVRVIDYVFDEKICEEKPTDGRWLKFSKKRNNAIPTHFDITTDNAWATIAASALACGAFPIAFPPVLLKRYQEEYNIGFVTNKRVETIQTANFQRSSVSVDLHSNKKLITEWPLAFVELQKEIEGIEEKDHNSFFNDEEGTRINYKSFNFPYVDGGTFNNEPIKEAYRIASFQDYKTDTVDTERLILFVDPIVRKEQSPSFNVSSFSPISSGKEPNRSSEIKKLGGSIGSLIGLLKDQGRIKESDKIKDTKENLELKEEIFKYLDSNEKIKLTEEICMKAFDKIRNNLTENIISIGTRKPVEYFIQQLRKSVNGEWEGTDFDTLDGQVDMIEDWLLLDERAPTLEEIYKAFGISGKPISINIFARTVFKVISDVSLDTAGKNPKALNAAILPINIDNEIIDLPGTEIEAFAGFASKSSKQYAFEYGRFSTLLALSEENGFRKEEDGGALIKSNDQISLEKVKSIIIHDIKETKFYSKENNYSHSLKTGLFVPSIQRIKTLIPLNNFLKGSIMAVPGSVSALFGSLFVGIKGLVKLKSFSINSVLNDTANQIADSVNYMPNDPVTMALIGDSFAKPWFKRLGNKHKIGIRVYFEGGGEKKIKAVRVYENIHNDKRRIWFRLFMIKDSDKEIHKSVGSKIAVKEDDRRSRIKLVAEDKTRLPKGNTSVLDPNLNIKEWSDAFKKNFPSNVIAIKVDGMKDKISVDHTKINNEHKTLFHSLYNKDFHVNPMLEFDVSKKGGEWYFKENTMSFDKKLMQKTL